MESDSLNGSVCDESDACLPETSHLEHVAPIHPDLSSREKSDEHLIKRADVSTATEGVSDEDNELQAVAKPITLGCRDRMSMVMEESDEELVVCNLYPSSDELDTMFVRNSLIVQKTDTADVLDPIALFENASSNGNHRPSPAAVTDTGTNGEHEAAMEFENQRPMGERWVETNYATVLRQSNAHARLQNSHREDPSTRVISVRAAQSSSANPVDDSSDRQKVASSLTPTMNSSQKIETNNTHTRTFENGSLENSVEPVSGLDEPSVSPDLREERSHAFPTLNSVPAAETNNVPTETLDDRSLESLVEQISRMGEPSLVNSNHHTVRSQTLPPLNSIPKTESPSVLKQVDRIRCFACATPVYMLEGIYVLDRTYHKKCFRCHKCQRILSLGNYSVNEGNPYCQPHYMEIFRLTGRYENASVNNYDDLRMHQSAVQSSAPAETERERPPPQLTRTLVAKFQQMCTDGLGFMGNGRCSSSHGSDQTSISSSPHHNLYRSSVFLNQGSSTAPIPTPFQQAGQLLKAEGFRKDSIEFDPESMQTGETSSLTQTSISSDGDFPNPGLTRDLVAKFTAMHAA